MKLDNIYPQSPRCDSASYLSWTLHCPSGNYSIEAGDMGAREKMSHLSLSHRPLTFLGPDVYSQKAEPTCLWRAPLPHPCSCHSCRSTGLQGAGSGSRTPLPQSSGDPHQCHGAGYGHGTVSVSAEETPTYSQPPAEQCGAWANLPVSASPQPTRQMEGEKTWGDLETFTDTRMRCHPKERKKMGPSEDTKAWGIVDAQ